MISRCDKIRFLAWRYSVCVAAIALFRINWSYDVFGLFQNLWLLVFFIGNFLLPQKGFNHSSVKWFNIIWGAPGPVVAVITAVDRAECDGFKLALALTLLLPFIAGIAPINRKDA